MFAHIDCHYFVYYQLFAGALLAIVRNISFKTRDTRYNLSAIRLCGVIIYTTEIIAMSSLQQSPPSNTTVDMTKSKMYYIDIYFHTCGSCGFHLLLLLLLLFSGS